MNITEYESIKDLSYEKYCDYLQKKYGPGICSFMFPSWQSNPKCKRTKEGLVAHHKFEDCAPKLSDPAEAQKYPYEWQHGQHIVYCDYLEHMLLHIIICEEKFEEATRGIFLGIRGLLQYIIPELNDVYSGWKTTQSWRATCHSRILDDKDVYLKLIQRFKERCYLNPLYSEKTLLSSYNGKYGLWEAANNKPLWDEIKAL